VERGKAPKKKNEKEEWRGKVPTQHHHEGRNLEALGRGRTKRERGGTPNIFETVLNKKQDPDSLKARTGAKEHQERLSQKKKKKTSEDSNLARVQLGIGVTRKQKNPTVTERVGSKKEEGMA